MSSICVSLKPDLLEQLNEAVEKYGFSKSTIAQKAISQYLLELEEDREDYKIAEKAWLEFEKGDRKTYTLSEVEKELGL